MTRPTDIAVVGVGSRYPDAATPQDFWRNIEQGSVAMRELTEAQLADACVPQHVLNAPGFVRMGATLPGVTDWAADFFGYTPKEAETIDPQQRIFLEAAWEALEAAGHPPRDGCPRTGVFAASYAGHYSAAVFTDKARRRGLRAAIDDLDLTVGGQPDFLTSRAAYRLGLRGPAVSIQTGCSASLYALHYATLSLLSGEVDIAFAGGATVIEPFLGYLHAPGGVLSEDGYCRSYDASSTGTVYSSGIGVVALRRVSDALADGDPILAVVRGSAVGNDGGDRLGYVAPSPAGVAEVVGSALRVSDVPAESFPTRAMPLPDWQKLVGDEAIKRGNQVMSTTALWEQEDAFELDEDGVQARNWRTWLRRNKIDPAVTGEQLVAGMRYLTGRLPEVAELLPDLAGKTEER
jgi:phthiocerol/phenolphthiocerol synthesis type-I polyketide synthase E